MSRDKRILAAGAMTGLAIITLLALGFGNLRAVAEGGVDGPQEETQTALPQITNLTTDEALQAWQQYSAELEQTVRTMQDRENTYQSQIDLANQTILQLQGELNTSNSTAGIGKTNTDNDDHEDHETHEEFEEHEVNDD